MDSNPEDLKIKPIEEISLQIKNINHDIQSIRNDIQYIKILIQAREKLKEEEIKSSWFFS
tara:strand:- start:414 stop:593 length:180 start_codon:yes stop_codon:yes gene_type:complete